MKIRNILAGLAMGMVAATAGPVLAKDTFPNKPISIIVPVTPGGTSDFLARLVAQRLSAKVGVPVVVENRAGAGGITGSVYASQAAPDGYTLFLASGGTHSINPSVYKKLPYDAIKDFEPVIRIATTANVLVTNKKLPVSTVAELIEYGKQNPKTLTFASSGTGSSLHLTGEMFKHLAGIDMLHVPYKGSAPAVTDLIGGQVHMMFDNIPSSMPHVRSGTLKAIAVSSSKRSPYLPDVPTIQEAGIGDFDLATWFGLLAPAGTPKDVVNLLNKHLVEVLNEPDVIKQFADRGAEVGANSPDDFGLYMRDQLATWKRIAEIANVQVE